MGCSCFHDLISPGGILNLAHNYVLLIMQRLSAAATNRHRTTARVVPTMNKMVQFHVSSQDAHTTCPVSIRNAQKVPTPIPLTFLTGHAPYLHLMEVFSYRALPPSFMESNAQPTVLIFMETAKGAMEKSRGNTEG